MYKLKHNGKVLTWHCRYEFPKNDFYSNKVMVTALMHFTITGKRRIANAGLKVDLAHSFNARGNRLPRELREGDSPRIITAFNFTVINRTTRIQSINATGSGYCPAGAMDGERLPKVHGAYRLLSVS